MENQKENLKQALRTTSRKAAYLQQYAFNQEHIKETEVTFEALVKRYEEWALKVFDTTPAAACEGLKREADELKKDIEENRPAERCLIEAADVLCYLIYILRRKGWTLEQLYAAMNIKIEINSRRNWSKNMDGTYSHVK